MTTEPPVVRSWFVIALVVASERPQRRAVTGTLLGAQVEVDEVATEVEAVEMLARRVYGLVVLTEPYASCAGVRIAAAAAAQGYLATTVIVVEGDVDAARARAHGGTPRVEVIAADQLRKELMRVVDGLGAAARPPRWPQLSAPGPRATRLPAAAPRLARRRRTSAWLLNDRGRPFSTRRSPGVVGFRVLRLDLLSRTWEAVAGPDAAPLLLGLEAHRVVFEHAVGRRPGWYQLVPVDARGVEVAPRPQAVLVRPRAARPRT